MSIDDLPLPAGFAERFWSKADRSGECWEWQAQRAPNGYGRVGFHHRMKSYAMYAHRMAYLLTYGVIADGLAVCHHCDNRACVRPDHLFMGTPHDNHMDMVQKGRAWRQGQRAPRQARPRLSHDEWMERRPRGAGHYKARLTAEQVAQIRERCAAGETQRAMAVEFGVSRSAIGHIMHGRSWAERP